MRQEYLNTLDSCGTIQSTAVNDLFTFSLSNNCFNTEILSGEIIREETIPGK
jgi:hypothetical protein